MSVTEPQAPKGPTNSRNDNGQAPEGGRGSRPIWGPLIALAVCGIALGLLVGLSTSPVVQGVLVGLLAIMGGIVTTLAGLPASASSAKADSTEPPSSPTPKADAEADKTVDASVSPAISTPAVAGDLTAINPVPAAYFITCIALGAIGGVWMRTSATLRPGPSLDGDPGPLIRRWRVTGLKETEIATRLFDQLYPPNTTKSSSAEGPGNKSSAGKAENQSADYKNPGLFGNSTEYQNELIRLLGKPDSTLQGELRNCPFPDLNRAAESTGDAKQLRAAVVSKVLSSRSETK